MCWQYFCMWCADTGYTKLRGHRYRFQANHHEHPAAFRRRVVWCRQHAYSTPWSDRCQAGQPCHSNDSLDGSRAAGNGGRGRGGSRVGGGFWLVGRSGWFVDGLVGWLVMVSWLAIVGRRLLLVGCSLLLVGSFGRSVRVSRCQSALVGVGWCRSVSVGVGRCR